MEALVDGLTVHYEEAGSGDPVILLHGSGPGVSAAANWSRTIPMIAKNGYRVIAPDVIGFGRSAKPEDFPYGAEGWARNLIGLMDALDIEAAHVVGNSMGGRIALTLAVRAPERVRTLTAMGVRGPETGQEYHTLGRVRAYEPSPENMRRLLELFVVDPSIITEEMVMARYEASVAPGAHEHYRRMFASGAANLMPLSEAEIGALDVPVLVVHGREDRVIPVQCAYQLAALIPDVVAVIVGRCGHWVQVERPEVFEATLLSFLARATY